MVVKRFLDASRARVHWQRECDGLGALQAAGIAAPTVRFAGQVGEQGTFFVRDPAGNALEFKSFRDPAQLFATD